MHGFLEVTVMSTTLRNLLTIAGIALAGHASANVTLFSQEGFHGRSFSTDQTVWNLDGTGFNDRAASAIVRGEPWVFCSDARFEGHCVTLNPGEYPNLARAGLNKNISSARQAEGRRHGYGDYRSNESYRGWDHDR
jgi:hypothetical protein